MPVDAPSVDARVSVITTVHNGERYVAAAIESILAQTFGNFEYLLVNDASTDRTPEILSRYATQDARLVALNTSAQLNHSNAINTALKIARGEFVAVLDADDVAYPERLERQVGFLDSHPDVGVVGAQVEQIDEDGHIVRSLSYPTTYAMARWTILFGTPVLHSAALVRRSLLEQIGGYSVQWHYANDYSLWAELINRTKITNLAETLVGYRRHKQQLSALLNTPQQGEVWLLILRMLAERLSLRVRLNDVGLFYRGVRGSQLEGVAELTRAADLLMTVRERYLTVEQPDAATTKEIDMECARRLLRMAWVHRHTQRTTSRMLLQRALEIDPLLWQRPQTGHMLRRYRHKG